MVEQQPHEVGAARVGRRRQWSGTAAPGKVDVGAVPDERRDCLALVVFGGEIERRRSVEVARVEKSAVLEEELGDLGLPRLGGAAQGHCTEAVARLQ